MPQAHSLASFLAVAGSVLLFSLAAPHAQDPPKVKPSQRASVSQRVADTTISIEYSRPVARGRELFGALVPYGKIWCPGADDATTIEVSTSIKIDGHDLKAGKYSVWAIPNEGTWTVVLNKQSAAWHNKYPEGQDALRFDAVTRVGSHMETLAFYFPAVDGKKAELVIHWGTTVVPMAIEVP